MAFVFYQSRAFLS